MNTNPWHICVLIPARNEEKLLARCLNSVFAAKSILPAGVTCDIVVAVDLSTDSTLEIAQTLVGENGVVVMSCLGIVGHARSLAASVALERYSGPLDHCWIANTDADCSVPRSWLTDQLILAMSNFDAVAGTIEVDSFEEHSAGVAALFRASYIIHPDGSHPHVHGANLGVSAAAYVRSGGWAGLSTAEDHDLWRRLYQSGSNCVSVGEMRVITSGRRVGRAPLGFAGALAAHNEVVL